MTTPPDSVSTFVRFIQLKSLRARTQEEYVRWVTRIARHCGVACASLLSQEEVLGFVHHLQQNHEYEGSTLNQCVCGLRLFFRDHLGRADWTCWSQIRIKRSVPIPTVLARAEVKTLLASVKAARFYNVFALMYHCGLRLGEVCRLEVSHLDRARDQTWFYEAMFKAMQQTLHTFAQDEQHLGGTPGYTAVLHTWTRELLHHPHLHVIMPGLALSADGLRVRRAKGRKFLFPVKALGAFFRNRVSELIAARDVAEQTQHHRDIDAQVWTMKWIIDAQGVGRGQSALRYLARYVKKSALSEQRLQGYDEQGNIKLNCQKSGSKQWHIITLTPDEFIRRWSLHVLPQGLMRVRHYGLHSAAAKAKLARVQSILGQRAKPAPAKLEAPKPKCPCCGKDMQWQREIKRAPHWWNALIEHREEQLAATPATGPPPALIITRGQARATSAELTTA
jgi:integrase